MYFLFCSFPYTHPRSHSLTHPKYSQIQRIENELTFLQGRHLDRTVTTLQTTLTTLQASLDTAQQEEAQHASQRDAAQHAIDAKQQEAAQLKTQAEGVEKQITAQRQGASTAAAAAAKARRALASLETSMEAMQARRNDVLEQAVIEQVTLPLADAAEGPTEGPTDMDIDGGAGPSNVHGEGAGGALDLRNQRLDFSGLPRALRGEDMSVATRDEREGQLRAQVEEVAGRLSNTAPNLKVWGLMGVDGCMWGGGIVTSVSCQQPHTLRILCKKHPIHSSATHGPPCS